ncbi:urease accessory protein [Nitratireductor indicus]|nr:urease accessory protein [Nitratireductor indicus]
MGTTNTGITSRGTTATTMTDAHALQRLLTWASPAFPVGGFAYSAGLETAIADGRVKDRATTREWIDGALRAGAARNDAILLSQAHRDFTSPEKLQGLADLCLALTPARERYRETLAMGEAFVTAARAWPSGVTGSLPSPCPYPIAFGALAAAHGIALLDALLAFLTAYMQAQVSVAVRLVPIGQSDGLAVIAALEPLVAEEARNAQHATLEDIGGIAYGADIAQMRHETLTTRVFKS